MLFAPVVASLAAFATVATAAPVPSVEERGLLSGLLGSLTGTSKATQLQTIVIDASKTLPVTLNKIQSLVNNHAALHSILDAYVANATASDNTISLATVQANVAKLSGLISDSQLGAINDALAQADTITPGLSSFVDQTLDAIKGLADVKQAINVLTTSKGANNLLAALTTSSPVIATALSQILTSSFRTVGVVTTQVSSTLDNVGADTAAVSALVQSLRAPIDTTLSGILTGSNTVVSGTTSLVKALLAVKTLLKSIVTPAGLLTSLSALLEELALPTLRTVLGA